MDTYKATGMREAFLIFAAAFALLHLYIVVSLFQDIIDADGLHFEVIALVVIGPTWYLLFQCYILYLQIRLRGFYWLLVVEFFGCGLLQVLIFLSHGNWIYAVLCVGMCLYFVFLNKKLFPFLHARTVD